MISAKSTTSIRKKDLVGQKTPAVAISSLYFAHKALLGDTGFNLLNMTNPSAEMPTHVQPSNTQLNAANLLFSQNNLILISSVNGALINKRHYSVVSNTQINFLTFTAVAGEIFTGLITSALATGTRVVSSAVAPVTGTLAATQTDFPVGTPFRAGAFSTAQVGEVMVFLDGLQQYRNTGNSNVTLDGNYYEVDPGSGISSVIRFNTADPVNARAVTVIYTNAVSERPDGSQMAAIEAIQGQVNTMIPVLADASGQPQSYFRVAPTNQDLTQFGGLVYRKAFYDATNAWTVAQPLVGVTDGSAAPAGQIGEVINSQSSTPFNTGTSNTTTNLTSISLTPGSWLIRGGAGAQINTGTSVEIFTISITPTSTGTGTIPGKDNTIFDGGFLLISPSLSLSGFVVNVSSTTTYYLTGSSKYGGGQTRWSGYWLEAQRIR